MKKGFLFGLGIFMAGLVFAVVSSVTMGPKGVGETVSNTEFNQLINTLQGIYNDSETSFIGIGVPNPAVKLDIDGTIRANEICDEGGANCKDISAGWMTGHWETAVGEGVYYVGLPTTKVGIGTMTPEETLDVDGKIRAKGICDENGANCKDISTGWASGTEYWKNSILGGIYYSLSSGEAKVGIGVEEPTASLDVNGSMRLRSVVNKGVCDATKAGTIVYSEPDMGFFYGCLRNSVGMYEWRDLGVAPDEGGAAPL